ncbi:MAG: antitoxin [Acidimicrobiales bacterium]
MRTTIDLPPDLHAAARGIARDRGMTLSSAVAELIRRGLGQAGTVEFGRSERTGLPVAWVGHPVTEEDVRSLEDDG